MRKIIERKSIKFTDKSGREFIAYPSKADPTKFYVSYCGETKELFDITSLKSFCESWL